MRKTKILIDIGLHHSSNVGLNAQINCHSSVYSFSVRVVDSSVVRRNFCVKCALLSKKIVFVVGQTFNSIFFFQLGSNEL